LGTLYNDFKTHVDEKLGYFAFFLRQ